MFKLVTLFAAVALAAADPAVVAYRAGVLPYTTGILPYSGVLPYSRGILPYNAGVLPYNYLSPYSYPYNYGILPAFRTASIATQAPNSPAVELDPIKKVPLDTPEVAMAKIAHLEAKALETVGIHTVKKRSIITPLAYTGYPRVYSPAWISPYSAYRAPLYASTLGYARAYNTVNFHPY